MDESKYGVHQSHCCIVHGCKYGDNDCPVESGKIEQTYTCEYCDDKGIKSVEELLKLKEYFRNPKQSVLEILESFKELYLCSSNPFTVEQANRKLAAKFKAEEVLKKYDMLD